MKQRLFISFLLSMTMLIYGLEYLPFNGSMIDQVFSWAWTGLAVLVISGNGLHLLYHKNQQRREAVLVKKYRQVRAKVRG
ncbi:hypothetical protein [Halalkalibacter krulwichiae]|uniref:Uncharacterized protein n=1 Tax=Halalkalibacter krulwichiae TaxID=199441 RepID=A0A1X9MLJ2_9BACI|nr:hypothetical protein [Halalkalibacter krulwichiae]ARK31712.1 hypothetical protein BkAM31D_18750 [Halalkalibacter krulwichiae]